MNPSTLPVSAYVALGANLGEPIEQLREAVERLRREFDVRRCSSIYRTKPVGNPEPQPDYYNMAVEIVTTLTAAAVFEKLAAIETAMGRERHHKNEARRIDLDLIFFGDSVSDEPRLRLPHPEAHRRDFVLAPIAEIAPTLRHPRLDKNVVDLLAVLPGSSIVETLPFSLTP